MKFGLTQDFPCSYLPEQKERLLVFVEEQDSTLYAYNGLIAAGFRRSGEQVYRPHCEQCQACQSIRIPVFDFQPSRNQKRIGKRNSDIKVTVSHTDKPEYYELYCRYIEQRHDDGTMYPPSEPQYDSFIRSLWMPSLFIEFHLDEELVAVAVTDQVEHGLSAMYTFFAPELAHRSLGIFAIMTQIDLARSQKRPYLYLGYQVDGCRKMDYKRLFLPHERFFQNKWHRITKKPA